MTNFIYVIVASDNTHINQEIYVINSGFFVFRVFGDPSSEFALFSEAISALSRANFDCIFDCYRLFCLIYISDLQDALFKRRVSALSRFSSALRIGIFNSVSALKLCTQL